MLIKKTLAETLPHIPTEVRHLSSKELQKLLLILLQKTIFFLYALQLGLLTKQSRYYCNSFRLLQVSDYVRYHLSQWKVTYFPSLRNRSKVEETTYVSKNSRSSGARLYCAMRTATQKRVSLKSMTCSKTLQLAIGTLSFGWYLPTAGYFYLPEGKYLHPCCSSSG